MTEKPELKVKYPIDAFVIPAILVPNETFAYPFIAYGPSELINLSIVKGCFDYMKEPWEFNELLFRIALITKYRLYRGKMEDELHISGSFLCYGSKNVFLTLSEVKILIMLMNNAGLPVEREALSYAVWGEPSQGGSRVIDVHISSLRKKMGYLISGSRNEITAEIRSVRGVGYTFLQSISTRR